MIELRIDSLWVVISIIIGVALILSIKYFYSKNEQKPSQSYTVSDDMHFLNWFKENASLYPQDNTNENDKFIYRAFREGWNRRNDMEYKS